MDDRLFNPVRIMTSQPGRMRVITSALRAAECILNDWPIGQGEKLSDAREALLSCLERRLSPGAARIAFIEAAKEAGNYVDEPRRLAPAGKVKKSHRARRRFP
ncbi:hypothetical protein J2X72_001330 [Phyllobacterium sp. 1468]|uniref:DUF982 domain-containing protein n=1 Tax=Phyllobacterium sp. 1468 TaxID=2817759 RepID=UPI00285F8E30|nr:DUF982 domain-containing protein [Phyllobacterium sp. 1468]MDR6632546.1 hypothetical protein [Phyllobacterium sp. 1468]